jgi:pimeloyl-ACP methyl ester carboxylesterase
VVNGAQDPLVPPANAAMIASRVRSSDLRIVADAGHAVMFQYLNWFAAVVDAAASGHPVPDAP